MAHKWTGWLHKSYRLGGTIRLRAQDKIRSGNVVGYVLSVLTADPAVRVVESLGEDLEGGSELYCPPEPPPPRPPAPHSIVHFRAWRRLFKLAPPHPKARRPLPSKEWKARRLKPNLPWTPTWEDPPKILIRGEWCKVPNGYPTDVFGQLEPDHLFINDLAKQLVVELPPACQLSTNLGVKPKSSDTKVVVIYKRAFGNYL